MLQKGVDRRGRHSVAPMRDAIRISQPQIASDAKKYFLLAMQKPLMLHKHRNHSAQKAPVKILPCANACDSDSRCGLACDVIACDAKLLAIRGSSDASH